LKKLDISLEVFAASSRAYFTLVHAEPHAGPRGMRGVEEEQLVVGGKKLRTSKNGFFGLWERRVERETHGTSFRGTGAAAEHGNRPSL